MKATDLLKTQHKEVKALLEKVVESSGAEGAKLLEEITRNLLAHMIIEQEIFYPAGAAADLSEIDEGYEEHHLAREEIARAMRTASGDKTLFQARCKVLKELIEHHVEEEEDDMFPKLDKALGDAKMETLGAQMEPRFKELKALKLVALSRRAEEVEVLSDAKTGGKKRKPAPRKAVKRATKTRATAKRSAPAKKRARR